MTSERSLALVEEELVGALRSDVALLTETGERIVRAGGKRLRPRIVLCAYEAAGGREPRLAVRMAAITELLHTASLIHDDINDHSAVRRGQPSVNAALGNDLALLMGDYAFVRVLGLLASCGPRAIQIIAYCCVQIVEGETEQMLRLGDNDLTEPEYLSIVRRKTASLLSACAELGGLVADANETCLSVLRDYGMNLGIAFQIRDDTLDLVGDSDALGKPVISDLAQGKMSLATISALRSSLAVRAALSGGDLAQGHRLLRDSGAIAYAMGRAREFAGQAKLCLQALPASPARLELEGLADMAVDRCH